jgi:hypothetical protein
MDQVEQAESLLPRSAGNTGWPEGRIERDLGFVKQGFDNRRLDFADLDWLPFSFRWGIQTRRSRGNGRLLRSSWFRAMAPLLPRSLGGWQRRCTFLSPASFLRSLGTLRVAAGTHHYPCGRASPSRSVSPVPACSNCADRLRSSALSQLVRPPTVPGVRMKTTVADRCHSRLGSGFRHTNPTEFGGIGNQSSYDLPTRKQPLGSPSGYQESGWRRNRGDLLTWPQLYSSDSETPPPSGRETICKGSHETVHKREHRASLGWHRSFRLREERKGCVTASGSSFNNSACRRFAPILGLPPKFSASVFFVSGRNFSLVG